MTKLEQLIKELCPNGVEYKKLSDITTVARGVRVVREQLKTEGEIPVYQNSLKPLGYHDKSNVKANAAFVIGAGAAGEIGYSYTEFWAADDCYYFVCPDNLNDRYLYFVLMKNQPLLISRVRKASIPRLSRTVIENLVIPVPPIEIQAEIVKILDEYSTSVTALQQELEKELTARKKQYEYYRDRLLNFDVHGGATSDCEWRTLESFADVRDGTHDSPKPSDYGYPLVTSKNISGGNLDLTSCYLINENDYNSINQRSKVDITDVLVSMIGTIGETIIVTSEPNYAIKNIGLVKTGNLLTSKYIKYYISSSYGQRYIQENIKGTAPRYLSLTALRKFSIPVPPIEEQDRIVSILDRFDKLCNDISEGLPAEIEARRKQYEYYRDKLLSFEERKNV